MAHKEEVKSASHKDGGQSMDELDPWNPPEPPRRPTPPDIDLMSYFKLCNEWLDEVDKVVATSRRTKIITRDPTPEFVDDAFYNRLPRLMPIFEKDSTRSFLHLYEKNDYGMVYGFIITPIAFTQIVKHNALQCAKVALEGKARALRGFRANPNCMNRYGYFPLHEAAELFSVDMIKLLFRYGASANLRTAGAEVIEGLLPLHVAVENTCLHKYLEGNAFPNEEDLHNSEATVNYICKLIHLLCLPEMKIFLDTTRLLGEHTDSLVDELWNYIKHGQLVQTAILLLATQEQIRGGLPCKINDNRKPDGFSIIINRILNHSISLASGTDQKGKKKRQLEVEKKLIHAALLLIHVVSQVGERLNKYILSHPEVPYNMQVPHNEVFEHVSSILSDNGFCSTAEGINLGNLSCYENVLSKGESPIKDGNVFAIEAAIGTPCQHSKAEKVARNMAYRGWELKYARRSFFPYWRSALKLKSPFRVIPSVVDRHMSEELKKSWTKSASQGSSWISNLNQNLLQRAHQFSNHQPKRMFCSAALPLLKVLMHA